MTSSDREILISINNEIHSINTRLNSLENRVAIIEQDISTLKTQTQAISDQVNTNTLKIEMLQTTVYWGFAIIAFIAAVIPSWTSRKNDNEKPIIIQSPPQPHISYSDIREIVKLEIAQHNKDEKIS